MKKLLALFVLVYLFLSGCAKEDDPIYLAQNPTAFSKNEKISVNAKFVGFVEGLKIVDSTTSYELWDGNKDVYMKIIYQTKEYIYNASKESVDRYNLNLTLPTGEEKNLAQNQPMWALNSAISGSKIYYK